MSLLSTMQLAGNTLTAAQIGLQVVGQNVANVDTPGYSREVVNFTPAATQSVGALTLGTGVQVAGITQEVDNFVEQQLRGANADASGSQVESQTYQGLEGLINELGNNSLGSSLTSFFNSINEVLNSPDDTSQRNLAVLAGQTLTANLNNVAQQAVATSQNLDQQVAASAGTINQLVQQIRDLNTQITQTDGGSPSTSPAVGLTDQRSEDLTQLSNLININVVQQADGSVSVYTGGNYLVFGSQLQQVKAVQSSVNGTVVNNIEFVGTNAALDPTSGNLAGLISSRDQIVGGFLDNLNSFANTIAFEFNKVYASGQGLTGYQSVTSQESVADPNAPLDAAGLTNAPVNGSFDIQVNDPTTGQTQTSTINVNLTGLGQDSTLNSVVQQLNAVSGVAASINGQGQLVIASTSPNDQLAFSNDSSGLLASLGINTFFTGTSALDLGVNSDVVSDPTKFAASQSGIGQDTTNGVQLAGFFNQSLTSQNGSSLSDLYSQLTEGVTQNSAQSQAAAAGFQTYQSTLQGQSMAVSGVSIDEETINMLGYQRQYEASAKIISTINDLLNTLVNL
jgi:flagellar hook-associated protein 1